MSLFVLLPLLVVLLNFAVPETASAQFVTCDGFNVECTACNLVEMVNKGIVALFSVVGLIFAIIMMKAGFGLVTSGGNTAALNAAKSAFQNALIGLLIVMAAWLIVDLVMRTLVKGDGDLGAAGFTGWGPWSKVQCQDPSETKPFVDLNTGHGGTTSVPGTGPVEGATTAGACKIPALSVLTGAQALSMERGSSVVYNSPTLKTCAERFISKVSGARVNSAYRPQEYQTHLWEIRDRWCTQGLRSNTDSTCSALKSAIGAEVTKHFGAGWACGAVAKFSSRHGVDGAVDIGGISNHADPAVQKAASESCLIWKNYPGDPWHYDLKPGCTCS
jgi:hypothetical protein